MIIGSLRAAEPRLAAQALRPAVQALLCLPACLVDGTNNTNQKSRRCVLIGHGRTLLELLVGFSFWGAPWLDFV